MGPGFPFTPGSAREVPDPAAEAEKLADARKAATLVTVPARDLAILVALATIGVTGYTAGLPEGVTIDDATAVLERYVTW